MSPTQKLKQAVQSYQNCVFLPLCVFISSISKRQRNSEIAPLTGSRHHNPLQPQSAPKQHTHAQHTRGGL